MTAKAYQAKQNGSLIIPGTITATQILDGTIMNGDINISADIAISKLANLGAAGNVFKTNGATNVAGQVANGDIAAGADIALAKLIHVGAGNLLKSNGSANVAAKLTTADITAMTVPVATASQLNAVGEIAQAYVVRSSAGMAVGNAWSGDASGLNVSINIYGGPVIVIVSATMVTTVSARYGRFAIFRNSTANSVGQLLHYFQTGNVGQCITLVGSEPALLTPGSYNYFFAAQSNDADTNVQWMSDGYRTMTIIELKR